MATLMGVPGPSGRSPSALMTASEAAPPAIGAMFNGPSLSASRASERGVKPVAANGVAIGRIPASPPPETATAPPDDGASIAGIRSSSQGSLSRTVLAIAPCFSSVSAAIRLSFDRTYWTICENGVIPAIGSLPNSHPKATAPSSFPSM